MFCSVIHHVRELWVQLWSISVLIVKNYYDAEVYLDMTFRVWKKEEKEMKIIWNSNSLPRRKKLIMERSTHKPTRLLDVHIVPSDFFEAETGSY